MSSLLSGAYLNQSSPFNINKPTKKFDLSTVGNSNPKPNNAPTDSTTATTDSKGNRDPKGHIISKKAVRGIIKKYFKGNDAGFDPEFEKKFTITEQCMSNCVMLKNKGDWAKGEIGDKIVQVDGKPLEIDGKPVTYSEYNEAVIRSALIKILSHPKYRLMLHDTSVLGSATDSLSTLGNKLGIPKLGIRDTMSSMGKKDGMKNMGAKMSSMGSKMGSKMGSMGSNMFNSAKSFGSKFTRKNASKEGDKPTEGDKPIEVEMTEVKKTDAATATKEGGSKSRKHKKHAKKYTKKQQKYKKPKKNTTKPKNKTHKK